MDTKTILIVEDDADISMIEEAYLQAAGYRTVTLTSGERVSEYLQNSEIALVLLDLMLPGKSGYDICDEIREQTGIPILMVTALGESLDKIRGLGKGADDYITKPFDPAELVARVGANMRQYDRLIQSNPPSDHPRELIFGNVRILPDSWKAYKRGKEIRFPNREFELLCFLAENPNHVFSREQLFEKVWGYDYVGDSATVMVHINRIRDKIEDDPKNPTLIETVWGAGYRMNR